jgi:hypothetical protein
MKKETLAFFFFLQMKMSVIFSLDYRPVSFQHCISEKYRTLKALLIQAGVKYIFILRSKC